MGFASLSGAGIYFFIPDRGCIGSAPPRNGGLLNHGKGMNLPATNWTTAHTAITTAAALVFPVTKK